LGKIRINKLALELNIQSDQILDALKKKEHAVKNYMSSIDVAIADEIRALFTPKPESTTKATKAKTIKKVPLKKGTTEKKSSKTKTKTKKTTENTNYRWRRH
jgi:translation initiation factor IF-2